MPQGMCARLRAGLRPSDVAARPPLHESVPGLVCGAGKTPTFGHRGGNWRAGGGPCHHKQGVRATARLTVLGRGQGQGRSCSLVALLLGDPHCYTHGGEAGGADLAHHGVRPDVPSDGHCREATSRRRRGGVRVAAGGRAGAALTPDAIQIPVSLVPVYALFALTSRAHLLQYPAPSSTGEVCSFASPPTCSGRLLAQYTITSIQIPVRQKVNSRYTGG